MVQVIQIEHPQVKGHMVNMTVSERTSPKYFKRTKAQRRELRQYMKGFGKPSVVSVFERGAAKILGLVSSHIYASKPE